MSPSPSSFSHCYAGPTLGSSDHSAAAVCKHATTAFRALERRYRVSPQSASQPFHRAGYRVALTSPANHRLRAAPPCATAGHPAIARSRQSPGDHSICAPKDTHRRHRLPATPPPSHEPKLANRRRRAPCCASNRPKPARHLTELAEACPIRGRTNRSPLNPRPNRPKPAQSRPNRPKSARPSQCVTLPRTQ